LENAPDATATLNGGAFITIPSGATEDIELVDQTDTPIVPDSVVGNKITVIKTMFWELNFNDVDDIIFIVATASNIGTFTSGSGTDVGTIEVSTDGVNYVALTFPFVPVVATTYYFKRSTFLVTGNYQIVGTYA
jgi:hypothetical protein